MNIQLRTNQLDETFVFSEFSFFEDGSGCRVIVEVESRGFAVKRPLYLEIYCFNRFLDELMSMDKALIGAAKLKPLYEDDYIELTMTSLGAVIVHGELFEHSEHSQRIQFEFKTDQTVLRPLIDDLTLVSRQRPR